LFCHMSYGATLAWFLFLIILIVTILLFGTARYWVYYAGEGAK
jgi:multiple sugar transport system permease protein